MPLETDLAALAGAPRRLTLDGESYEVFPLTLSDFAELQRFVDTCFPDPMELVGDLVATGKLSVAKEQFLLKAGLEVMASRPRPRIGMPEADRVLQSIDGIKEILYLGIRKGRPGWTREDAEALFGRLSLSEISRVFHATDVDLVTAALDPKASATSGTAAE